MEPRSLNLDLSLSANTSSLRVRTCLPSLCNYLKESGVTS